MNKLPRPPLVLVNGLIVVGIACLEVGVGLQGRFPMLKAPICCCRGAVGDVFTSFSKYLRHFLTAS